MRTNHIFAGEIDRRQVKDMGKSGAKDGKGSAKETWASGSAYEKYVGRWSRHVAREFLSWLEVPPESRWLDVGCGTGALTEAILAMAAPVKVRGIDASPAHVEHARSHVTDERASLEVGDAQAIQEASDSFDAVVSGLMINFIPRPEQSAAEMARVARPGGVVAAYVWDYPGRMQMMRYFWDTAGALDPRAQELDEGKKRFTLCQPEPLAQLFSEAGLRNVEVRGIEIPTIFRDFDDFWLPFLGGQGPAPGYVVSLSDEQRAILKERLRSSLPTEADGSIHLVARAWAVRGTR